MWFLPGGLQTRRPVATSILAREPQVGLLCRSDFALVEATQLAIRCDGSTSERNRWEAQSLCWPRPASRAPRPSSWEEPFASSGLLTTPRTHRVPSCFHADSPTREAQLPPFERDPSPPSPPAPHPEAFQSPVRPQRALLPITEFSLAHLCLQAEPGS